jgi:TolB protein
MNRALRLNTLTTVSLSLISFVALSGCEEMRGFITRDTGVGDGNNPPMDGTSPVDDLATPSDQPEVDMGSNMPVDVPNGADIPSMMQVDVPSVARDVAGGPVDLVVRVAGTPADAQMQFGGATNNAITAPEIVYPENATVVPPNIRGLEYHLRGPAGADLFELSFTGRNGRVRIYSTCMAVGGGCVIPIDDTAMSGIADAALGEELAVTVRGHTAAGVGRATMATLGVSATDLRGGVYWWNNNADTSNAISRFDWGLPGARLENFRQGNAFGCVGCHSVARNGSRLAIGHFIPGPATTQVFDAITRMPVTAATIGTNFTTFNPDGSLLLASEGVNLNLFNAGTQMSVSGAGLPRPGTQPDWSPDGSQVVYSQPRAGAPVANPGHNAPANLVVMPYIGGRFAASSTLINAPDGENNYYPSWAPDSNWIIFNRSVAESYAAPSAQLWAIRATGGGAAIHLAAADRVGQLTNSWPRVAPFVDSYGGERIFWFTFSSKRNYGLRLLNESVANDRKSSQIWMAAFRVRRGELMMDPSTPAFWLPFQRTTSANFIAQWTQVVQRRTCAMDMDCPMGERCVPLMAAGGMRCVGGM